MRPSKSLTALALAALIGVLALALQDGDELRTGLEEATPFADALEGAVEEGRPRAVTVGEQSTMVTDGRRGAQPVARAWCCPRVRSTAPRRLRSP